MFNGITPPKYVLNIIRRLRDAGFKAFLVGGCVRDLLLGLSPGDWDIASSALPGEVASLFERTARTGEKHGTITVLLGSEKAEVTTFRTESGYSDHRRPDAVAFVADLREDLSRRDFTINAMAMDETGAVIDYFGGVRDLRSGLIRCVGEPEDRFEEDSLRMLRALRFSAVFGFEIESSTLSAVKSCSHLAASLSSERVRDEVGKILASKRPETLGRVIELGLLNRFLRPLPIDFGRILWPDENIEARWCALCSALKQRGLIASVRGFMSALRVDGKTVSLVEAASRLIESGLPRTEYEMKRALNSIGPEAVSCAAWALRDDDCLKLLNKVLSGGECYDLGGLAVRGDDLVALGLRGREIGETLSALLDHVLKNPGDNERNILLNIAKKKSKLP